jgi:hypothetical protein
MAYGQGEYIITLNTVGLGLNINLYSHLMYKRTASWYIVEFALATVIKFFLYTFTKHLNFLKVAGFSSSGPIGQKGFKSR